jgi:hypothetical protein
MIYAAAGLSVSFFTIALRALAIPAITARVLETGREAARVMGDATMEDDDKERLLQRASLTMMRAFASITARSALAIAAAVIPLFAFHMTGIADWTAVTSALVTWQGIAMTAVLMTAAWFIRVGS